VGGWNVNPGYRLVDRPGQPAAYRGIAADYRHTFAVLKQLPCDVFLGAHASYFSMLDKLQQTTPATAVTTWIDPQGYREQADDRARAFQAELARQSK